MNTGTVTQGHKHKYPTTGTQTDRAELIKAQTLSGNIDKASMGAFFFF